DRRGGPGGARRNRSPGPLRCRPRHADTSRQAHPIPGVSCRRSRRFPLALNLLPAGSRRHSAEWTVIRQLNEGSSPLVAALNGIDANCFVADASMTLVWMNTKAQSTATQLAPVLTSTFGVNPSDLPGSTLHRFVKDPGLVDRLANEPGALPLDTTFANGGTSIRARVN